MTNTAYQIWETFKAELTQPATDDMKEALASAIRKIIDKFECYVENDTYDKLFVSSNDLYNLAVELENLKDI